MFNHMGINELELLCVHTIKLIEGLIKKQYQKKIIYDALLPISLVLREGGLVDARQLKAESEKFIKTELFKFCSLYEKDKLKEIFKEFDEIFYKIEKDEGNMPLEIRNLYEALEKPKVLLITNIRLSKIYSKYISEINWFSASTPEEAVDILSVEDINLILLDLWINKSGKREIKTEEIVKTINQGQDFTPLSARDLDEGRVILRRLHRRFPEIPIYLLSINDNYDKEEQKDYEGMTSVITIDMEREEQCGIAPEKSISRVVDDELFLACVRAGGARGLVATNFADLSGGKEWLLRRNQFVTGLLEINRRLYRERGRPGN